MKGWHQFKKLDPWYWLYRKAYHCLQFDTKSHTIEVILSSLHIDFEIHLEVV